MRNLNVAVVGSGISGLSAAWLLSQKHTVTLFESDHRLGGHAHTVEVGLGSGKSVGVDTGFIVSNTWTYPNFTALMDYLDVDMNSTRMTFSVSADQGRYEYSGDHLGTLLGRARQWLSPGHWRLVADLVRFYRNAEALLPTLPAGLTLGEFMARNGYSQTFAERHILPIAGAIWSTGTEAISNYPVVEFVKFFANHKLFMLGDRPDWQTVRGGSREYVQRLVEDGKFAVRSGNPVVSIRRQGSGVEICTSDGRSTAFDQVVIATHAGQALKLLDRPTPEETALLSVFATSRNRAVLHRDPSHMPHCRRFWSAWNYRPAAAKSKTVSVTYWMNALQKLDSTEQHFVTLNPVHEPAAHLIDGEYDYRHPVFTPHTRAAQENLWTLQGHNNTWFAGAWFGAGFHEDGLQSGLAVAEQLGQVRRPWNVANESGRICVSPVAIEEPHVVVEAAE